LIDYVLVRADKPRALEVQEALARVANVREVHPLFGEWDILAKVMTEPSLEGADILFAISGVPGVIETKWLGVSRIGSDARVLSNLSNMQARSDAL